MALDDYMNWQSRRQGAGRPEELTPPPAADLQLQEARPEPAKVQEHPPVSTTIVQRLYASLGKRR